MSSVSIIFLSCYGIFMTGIVLVMSGYICFRNNYKCKHCSEIRVPGKEDLKRDSERVGPKTRRSTGVKISVADIKETRRSLRRAQSPRPNSQGKQRQNNDDDAETVEYHQYETILEAVKHSLEASEGTNIHERFCADLKKAIAARNVLRNLCDKENSKEVQCSSSPQQHYSKMHRNITKTVSENPYETLVHIPKNLPKRSISLNNTSELELKFIDNNKTKINHSYGSNDHLKFLKEKSTRRAANESFYMEARSFLPTKNCPENLRSLCPTITEVRKKPPPLPKRNSYCPVTS